MTGPTNGHRDEATNLVWTKFIDAGAGMKRGCGGPRFTILRTLLERGPLTAPEVASIARFPASTVSSAMFTLVKTGYLVKTGEMRRPAGKFRKMSHEYDLAPIPPLQHAMVPVDTNRFGPVSSGPSVSDRRVVALEEQVRHLKGALTTAEEALWKALEAIESAKAEKVGAP